MPHSTRWISFLALTFFTIAGLLGVPAESMAQPGRAATAGQPMNLALPSARPQVAIPLPIEGLEVVHFDAAQTTPIEGGVRFSGLRLVSTAYTPDDYFRLDYLLDLQTGNLTLSGVQVVPGLGPSCGAFPELFFAQPNPAELILVGETAMTPGIEHPISINGVAESAIPGHDR